MAILAECPICRKKQSVRNRKCSCGTDLTAAKRAKKVRYWVSYRLPGGKQRRERYAKNQDQINAKRLEKYTMNKERSEPTANLSSLRNKII